MMDRSTRARAARWLGPLAVLALAACGDPEVTEPTYEADAIDEGGGELIVTDPAETGVPVELPETPMTPVPPEGGPAAAPSATPSAEPTPTPAE